MQPSTIEPPCAVVSPIRAAGEPPIVTVAEPLIIESGGPTQTQLSPMTAAGILPIMTVGLPGPITGPPTCGIGGKPGVTIGHVCISVNLAAGGIVNSLVDHYHRAFNRGITRGRQFGASLSTGF